MAIKKYQLPDFLSEKYELLKCSIQKRLEDFRNVPEADYFYELCFCLCTPQSKASNAFKVVEYLQKKDFYNKPFNPSEILRRPENYIRFHNTKADRILLAREIFPEVSAILKSEISAFEKRKKILLLVNGYGMKEASHFLRNIGMRNLAIFDRHILKHLVSCGLYDEIPNVSSEKKYLEVEKVFIEFSKKIGIPIDELDLLFWSYETGEILK